MNEHVSIRRLIYTNADFYKSRVDTHDLIWFINTYGVNYVDDGGYVLLNCLPEMTYDQIDIVLSHKPYITHFNIYHQTYIRSIGPDISPKSVYMIRKMLEYDHDFLFVSRKRNFDSFEPHETCLEFCRRLLCEEKKFYNKIGKIQYLNTIVDMLENHLKHYQSLFMIMLPEIE